MAVDTLGVLMDTPSNAEAVRDRIGTLLQANFEEQVTLATNAGEPPEDFDARVFTERTNPWEQLHRDDLTPIVNVARDSADFNQSASSVVDNQKAEQRFNIDCIAFGQSEQTAEGHEPGDLLASLEVQRVARMARHIIMAPQNTYLQLRGTVWKRWIESIQMLQPPSQGETHVVAARLTLMVHFTESAPQGDPNLLETVYAEGIRESDGKIVLAAQYDY